VRDQLHYCSVIIRNGEARERTAAAARSGWPRLDSTNPGAAAKAAQTRDREF